jgi:hypothetical protein
VSDRTNRSDEREALQFDTAEPAGPAAAGSPSLTCAVCKANISESYYEANGAIVCDACRAALSAQLAGGSEPARFAKAAVLGLAGAAAGVALYVAILAATGYDIGLVAIAVAFLVGKAVNRGSEGRGGPPYQVLAVVLTYVAIMTTHILYAIGRVPSTSEVLQLLPLAAAAPFRSIFGLVIAGFALFEAWRLNTRAQLTITGPYRVGAARG